MAHDISLLKLSRPAQLNDAVKLACLPGSSQSVQDGKMCWVTGMIRMDIVSPNTPKFPSVSRSLVLMEIARQYVGYSKQSRGFRVSIGGERINKLPCQIICVETVSPKILNTHLQCKLSVQLEPN